MQIKIKDEFSEIKRKISGMAKNNHSRVQGFDAFHLVQRSNYLNDLHCSCVCCSSQHHSNAKTKLSNRVGLSFFYLLRITYYFRRVKTVELRCSHCAYGIHTGTHLFLPLNCHHFVPSYCCTAVLISVRKAIRMNAKDSIRHELTISSYLGLQVLGWKPNQSSRPGNSITDRHHVVLQAFAYKTAKPREPINTLE